VDVTETGVALNGYPARDLKELRVRLTDVFGTRADKTLTVKATASVPYGKLAEVVSLAYQWGVKRVLVPSGG
jgi:biopolymer transport protein ExbD